MNILSDQSLQHLFHISDDGIQVQNARRQHLLPAEGQKLARHGSCPVAGFLDFLQMIPYWVVGVKTVQHQLAVPNNDGQEVVEIVGDSTRQSTDGLHLRRLPNLFFQGLALGYVLFGGNELGDYAARIPECGDVHLFGVEASVLSPVNEFTVPGLPIKDGRPKVLEKLRVVFARFQNPGVLPQNLLAIISCGTSECRVDILDVTGGVRNHYGFRGLLNRGHQACFLGLRPHALGDVAPDGRYPRNNAHSILNWRKGQRHMKSRSVLPLVLMLVMYERLAAV